MEKALVHGMRREEFFVDPSHLRTQQSLSDFYSTYLNQKHPEVINAFDLAFPIAEGASVTHAERMALRSCQPVTMWNFLNSSGAISGLSLEDFIDVVMPAFDYGGSRTWSRPKVTSLVRKRLGVPIISAGIKWLTAPITDESARGMIRSGYCDGDDDVLAYANLLHGKTVKEIVQFTPAVITIKNPVGAQMSHSVFAWDIIGDNLEYFNSDQRDTPVSQGTCILPVSVLDLPETVNGAVTILRK